MSINSILLHVGGQHDIKQYKRDKQMAKFVMNVKTSVLSDASYHLIGQKKKTRQVMSPKAEICFT